MRSKNVDILKFIGLFCIILAHVTTNKIIAQIRGFDVVLMIMVSSYLFLSKNHENNKIIYYFKYLVKRIKRLLLPTWIFLSLYFLILLIFKKEFTLNLIISSFLLHGGIGYVWIIRIYIITAILISLMHYILKKVSINRILILNSIIYVLYELLCSCNFFSKNILLTDIFAYIIPVITIIVVTYWIMNNKNIKLLKFSLFNFLIFVICAIIIFKLTGEIKNTSYMKYPFRIYYLSYSFFISSVLIIIFRNKNITDFFHNKVVEFVSKNSLWIYLWHILVLHLLNYITLHWIIEFILIILISTIIVYIQNKLIDKLEKTKINKEILKLFRG